ncbi:MAG: MBL fold metallo-hydrolase [Planctomycetes bacterium]|nr:MBL fold metallo-hydrolase [Planctomycetota bacterium]
MIHFEDGSLVILDCGRSGWQLRRLLQKITFDRINALILSHLHNDHCGGAHAILDHYLDKIDQILIPLDRKPELILANSLIQRLITLTTSKTAEKRPFYVAFLVRREEQQGRLHPSNDIASRAVLSVLYPLALQALNAQVQTDPNQGSGILSLECGNKRVLFPGDAGKMAFDALKSNFESGKRLECELIATPHHGGKLEKDESDCGGFANVYEWLYSEILDVKNAIFSVGSGNGFDHPRIDHMDAVRKNGSYVFCTQMTSQCHSNPADIGKSLLPILNPSACSRKGTGCAGTIVAKIFEDRIDIERFENHKQLVDALHRTQNPLCRRSVARTRTTTGTV